VRIGFRTSITALFVAIVLTVGLTLAYLSFERANAIIRTAATAYIDKVAKHRAEGIEGSSVAQRRNRRAPNFRGRLPQAWGAMTQLPAARSASSPIAGRAWPAVDTSLAFQCLIVEPGGENGRSSRQTRRRCACGLIARN